MEGGARLLGCARSQLIRHGQRLADVVQHQVRVDALRRGVVDELRGPHEFFRKQRIKDKYGEISNWDTSRVTDMFCMQVDDNKILRAKNEYLLKELRNYVPEHHMFQENNKTEEVDDLTVTA